MELPDDTVTATMEGIGPEPWPIECQECGETLSIGQECDHFVVDESGSVQMNTL